MPCELGWRNIIVEKGPEAFAKAVREYPGVLIMDTTWRDAHQSLLATRLRTIDMANIAKETSWALANSYSLECWGGATFDVAMRFLYEDPWERLVCPVNLQVDRKAAYTFPGYSAPCASSCPTFPSRPSSVAPTVWATLATRESFGPAEDISRNTDASNSDNAIYDFSKKAVENGLDIFRVFDSLNYIGTLSVHTVECVR